MQAIAIDGLLYHKMPDQPRIMYLHPYIVVHGSSAAMQGI